MLEKSVRSDFFTEGGLGMTRLVGLLALCALSFGLSSCGPPTVTLEMLGEGLEETARELQASDQAVQAELEHVFAISGRWVLVVVPPSGLDIDTLRSAGLSEDTVRRAEETAAGLVGRQQLVQIAEGAVLARGLGDDALAVQQQYVVSGTDAAVILFRFERRGRSLPPVLTSMGTRPR